MPELPAVKRIRKNDEEIEQDNKKRLIVIIEKCSLESAKIGKEYVILSSDRHANFIRNQKKDPADFRPDILHQCLLMLLDSPLNRADLLQIYVHTVNNILIEVNPQIRIPRTFDRFCGLMVQLLHKLSIRAADSSVKLLKVIRNPVSIHLPTGCRKVLTSYQASEYMSFRQFAESTSNKPIAVVIGGFAKGKAAVDYTEEEVKLSNFPLSAALTCSKLTSSFEEIWKVEEEN
ncbi:C2f protein [Loa loa]|uniref:18S rRNA (pseudouridine-N1)-methyltransferase n=1 Tax=Loa loa TaxID=7209 RepID=A0A1I7VKZ5_LOALO|nr:C2f protein [Loa loa]EFO24821.1 C2f protein [Loa loa]